MLVSSNLLQQMINKIIGIERSNIVSLSITILNRKDPNYKLKDVTISIIRIADDFNINNLVDIRMKCSIRTTYIADLIKHQNDLYCHLVVEYLDKNTSMPALDEAPEIYEYNMLIFDAGSIAKSIGIQHAGTMSDISNTPSIDQAEAFSILDIEFQLIPEDGYNFNKAAFMGLFKQVTIAKVIRYIANAVGVKRIYLVDPDNTLTYNHIYIPPQYWKIDIIFDYLQRQYGVYNAGITYYLSNGILYVYPPFDIEATRKNRITIIRTPPNTYLGAFNYHDKDGDHLTIISNSEAFHDASGHISSENTGNANMFIRADSPIDGQVIYGEEFKFTDTNVVSSTNIDNTIADRSISVKYSKPTINTYQHMSNFARNNTERIVVNWLYARLNMIPPGTPVDFVFDDKDAVMSKTGLVESALYQINRVMISGGRSIFNVTCVLALRLDIDQKKYEI